jgi:hypothetical protein
LTEPVPVKDSSNWKKFIKKHWSIFALFIVAIVLAVVGAIVVFLWFTGNAQTTGLVPSTLGSWTPNNVLTFVLYTILYEFLYIGIPAIIAAIIGYLWWRSLPIEEKKEYKLFGKRSRSSGGGTAVSVFFWIAFAIKIYLDGN